MFCFTRCPSNITGSYITLYFVTIIVFGSVSPFFLFCELHIVLYPSSSACFFFVPNTVIFTQVLCSFNAFYYSMVKCLGI